MIRMGPFSMVLLVVMGLNVGVLAGVQADSPDETAITFDSGDQTLNIGPEEVDLCEQHQSRDRPENRFADAVVEELDLEEPDSEQQQAAWCQDDWQPGDSEFASHPANVIDWSPSLVSVRIMSTLIGMMALIANPVAEVVYLSPIPDKIWLHTATGAAVFVPLGYAGLQIRRLKTDD